MLHYLLFEILKMIVSYFFWVVFLISLLLDQATEIQELVGLEPSAFGLTPLVALPKF